MKFINREKELKLLEEYYDLSKKKLMVIAISGLRRVGKTTLVKEFMKSKKSLYFFVYDFKTSSELLREFADELRKEKIISELEDISNWKVFFDVLFKRCNNYIVIFDEFQNFFGIDKSVFSIIQRDCDEYASAHINLIFLGSLIGLFKKIFEDKKQPLYGRISAKFKLEPFSLNHSLEALKHLEYKNFENMLGIYGFFGGFPKYYSSLEQFDLINKDYLDIIEYLFLRENAPLESEVMDILRQEFGKRSSLYYSILHSIATGKTKLNEIAGNIHMKESSITRHLSELEDKFSLIKAVRAIDNKKNTRYSIAHPLILFWFKFIYGKFSEYSLKNTKELSKIVHNGFKSFFGRRFEDICKEFILELNKKKKLPFETDYINNWQGYTRIKGVRKEIEIDLIALNDKLKKSMFIECKWKDKVDAGIILNELKEKSKFVNWHRENREEYFCIIAKSFKEKISEKNVFLFDLKDIENFLKS